MKLSRMMLIAAVGACAHASAACVVTSGDDPDSRLVVTWNLVAGDSNAPSACPPGAVTAAVVAEPVSDGDNTFGDGDEIQDVFYCIDGAGETAPLPSGHYEVWVDILDRDNLLVAQSGLQEVVLGVGEKRGLVYEISVDRGSFGLTWAISDGVRTASCGEVNAGEVQVASTLVGPGGTTYDDFFSCTAGQALTPGLPLGDYQVGVTLVDGVRAPLNQPLVIEASLDFGNAFVDLGSVEFVLEE
jgi:hypothetical protein